MENDETMIPDKDVSVFKTPKGINEDIVREISAIKGEPEWMLEYRLKAYRCFMEKANAYMGCRFKQSRF